MAAGEKVGGCSTGGGRPWVVVGVGSVKEPEADGRGGASETDEVLRVLPLLEVALPEIVDVEVAAEPVAVLVADKVEEAVPVRVPVELAEPVCVLELIC